MCNLCDRLSVQLRLVSTAPTSKEFAATKAASYQVYRQYQMAVHGDTEDKCCMRTFERFLCATPLKVRHGGEGGGVVRGAVWGEQVVWKAGPGLGGVMFIYALTFLLLPIIFIFLRTQLIAINVSWKLEAAF